MGFDEFQSANPIRNFGHLKNKSGNTLKAILPIVRDTLGRRIEMGAVVLADASVEDNITAYFHARTELFKTTASFHSSSNTTTGSDSKYAQFLSPTLTVGR